MLLCRDINFEAAEAAGRSLRQSGGKVLAVKANVVDTEAT